MRLLTLLAHTPAAKAFGWALFHFLWQGAALALLLALSFALLRGARARYAAACATMLAMVAAFAVTFALEYPRVEPIETAHARTRLPAPPMDTANLPFAPAPAAPGDPLPWIAPFWALGVLTFHLRSLGSWAAADRLKRRGVCAAPPEWQARLQQLAHTMRISKPVRLLETCLADTPVVAGYLKPVILVPAGMLAGLPSDQLEAILIHELAHIRRHDYLVNLLQTFIEGLLFYHPAVWWVSAAIRTERENCCDDMAASLSGGAHRYAVALAALEVNRSAPNQTALAANGGSLVKRIRRLLNQPESPRAIWTPVFSTVVLTVAVAVTAAAWQSEPADKPMPRPVTVVAPSVLPLPAAIAAVDPMDTPAAAARPVVAQSPLPKPAAAEPVLVAAMQEDRLAKLKEALQHELQRQRTGPIERSLLNHTGPYLKWLNEDVAYIIQDSERATYKGLQTDTERESFIEQFWLRRDPTPGTPENEFKDEHYRRIAYANDRFTAGIPGWKTDRGRIYITYGPPDEIEDHSSGGVYQRPPAEGGGTINALPFQQWRYKFIEGVGNNVIIEFVDKAGNGEFHMTADPSEKATLLNVPNAALTTTQQLGLPGRGGRSGSLGSTVPFVPATVSTAPGPGMSATVYAAASVDGKARVQVSLQLDAAPVTGNYDIIGEVVSGHNVSAMVRDSLKRVSGIGGPLKYDTAFTLAPGAYTVNMVIRDPTGATQGKTVNFTVN